MSYPSTLDIAEDLLIAANNVATNGIGFISSGQTAITIVSNVGLPASGVVSIDSEVIAYGYIDNGGGNPVLRGCTRGFDGTTAAEHVDGSRIELRWVAAFHNLLSAAIRAIEGTLGVNPQGSFADLATKLSATLPTTLSKTYGTTWTFTHTRKRVVSVQLWRLITTNTYELFFADVTQLVDVAGTSVVTIELSAAEQGYVIYS